MSSGSVPLGAAEGGVAGAGVEAVVASDAESEGAARQPRLPTTLGARLSDKSPRAAAATGLPEVR